LGLRGLPRLRSSTGAPLQRLLARAVPRDKHLEPIAIRELRHSHWAPGASVRHVRSSNGNTLPVLGTGLLTAESRGSESNTDKGVVGISAWRVSLPWLTRIARFRCVLWIRRKGCLAGTTRSYLCPPSRSGVSLHQKASNLEACGRRTTG